MMPTTNHQPRTSNHQPPTTLALPPRSLLEAQAEWLAPARARLLRKAGIAHRKRVLDIGCGYGIVTEELFRRCGGEVVALDRELPVLSHVAEGSAVGGEAARLPFHPESFDLVFAQNVLMWLAGLSGVIAEVSRVLVPGGVVVALEPDYGGMMEAPGEFASKDVWVAALSRAGADPFVGRELPGVCAQQGFTVKVEFFNSLHPPDARRWDLLKELPLTPSERQTVERLESQPMSVVHLPYFLILAEKKGCASWSE